MARAADFSPVTERLHRGDGLMRIVKTQTVSDKFFDAVRARKDSVHPSSLMRFRGSVPIMVAQRWAIECGAAIGTRQWRQYASNQLDKAEYAKLRGG